MNGLTPSDHAPYLPMETEVVARAQETRDMFTLRLRLTDRGEREAYRFVPGQFNMVHLPAVGAVPISIASDPEPAKKTRASGIGVSDAIRSASASAGALVKGSKHE